MSSLAKTGGFFRANPRVPVEPAEAGDDVVVIGQGQRTAFNATGTLATIPALIEAAEQRAAEMLAEAEAQAAMIIRQAEAQADAVREQAEREGFEAGASQGIAAGEEEIASLVDLARAACVDGKALRDQVAATSMSLLADAVALATRRIVGEWYDADPERTARICAEALRSASGQEILRLRVHSSISAHVAATLAAAGGYVVPDDAVAVGGCFVDLAGGTIDASLDARLSLMEMGLRHSTGASE